MRIVPDLRRSHGRAAGALLAIGFLAAPSARAQIELHADGGGTLGKVTTVTVSGAPGTQYLLIVSLSGGPTALPAPHQPTTLDVGFDLLDLSVTLPGFLGTLPTTGPTPGQVALPLPLPANPLLDPLTLHFQAVRIAFGLIDGKSEPWIVTPALQYESEPTLGSMSVRRAGYAALAEADGSVLFFGGGDDGLVASFGQTAIDRYLPSTQQFVPMPPMLHARTSHTATRLLDGRILLCGGADDALGEPVATAEIYDPATGTSVPTGNMSTVRALHGAALLPDGRVLITGGTTSFMNPTAITTGALRSTEIFDPVAKTFAPGPQMAVPRVGHSTTALTDGRVLVAGGFSWFSLFGTPIPVITDSAQLYVPATNAFVGAGTLTTPRFGHAALRLAATGDVVLVGGATTGAFPLVPVVEASVEIYSPGTGFTQDGFLSVARGVITAAELEDGSLVVAGGASGSLFVPTPDATIDVYVPYGGGTVVSSAMTHVRGNFTAFALQDGTVLLAGGGEEPDPQNPSLLYSYQDAEIFHP